MTKPNVSRKELNRFLLQNTENADLVLDAMSTMEPFFQKAETGRYTLAPASEELREKAKTAIAMATGKEVKEIIFISATNPFPGPEGISKEDYKNSVMNSLGDSLMDSLGDSLMDNLGNSLGDNLLYNLGISIEDSFGDSLEYSLGNSLWDNLVYNHFYFLGVTLINDTKKIERLTQLMQLLPQALLGNEKGDKPGTWYVLVA